MGLTVHSYALEMQSGFAFQATLTRWMDKGVSKEDERRHQFAERPALELVGPNRLLRLGFKSETHKKCPEEIKAILQQ